MNAFELGFREGLAKAAARSAEDVAHDIVNAAGIGRDRAPGRVHAQETFHGRVGRPPGVGSGEWRRAIEGAAERQARTARGRSVRGTAGRVLRTITGRGLTGKQKAMRAAAAALAVGGVGAAAVHGSKPSYERLGEKPKKR